jgi:hypothetical protein
MSRFPRLIHQYPVAHDFYVLGNVSREQVAKQSMVTLPEEAAREAARAAAAMELEIAQFRIPLPSLLKYVLSPRSRCRNHTR